MAFFISIPHPIPILNPATRYLGLISLKDRHLNFIQTKSLQCEDFIQYGPFMHPAEKKAFYFVRHGQTDANAKGLMCGGDWDVPLNSVGEKQSLDLSNKVITLNPSIKKIFSSPMIRTQQTARNINKKLSVEIATLEDLREWKVGDWEKQPWKDVPNPFDTTEEPNNGETRKAFEKRVISAVNGVLSETNDTVLLVSHGAFAHALFTTMGVDQVQIENCEIYKLSPFKNHWQLEKVT